MDHLCLLFVQCLFLPSVIKDAVIIIFILNSSNKIQFVIADLM